MPESYQTTKFKDLCQIITKRIDNPKEAKTDYYVGLEHLDSEEPKILRHGSPQDVSNTKFCFEKGDILFGRRRWYLRKLAVSEKDGICSTDIMVLRPKIQKIIKGFLPILMFGDEFYKKALAISAGTMSPRIRWKELAELVFPIPPLPEQKKIVNLVSRVDDSITKTQQLLEKLETYKTSKADELLTRGIGHKKFKKVKWLFGKEIEIPEEWEWEKLEDNSTLKGRIGWQGLTTAEYQKKGDYYLVTGTDFKDGQIDWKNCVYVDEERYSQDPNIQLKKYDVLVTKDGTIGKIAFVPLLVKPATLNSGVFVIRPINKHYFPLFLYHILFSNYFEKFLYRLQAGSTINHLYQKDFVNFRFPIPPLMEQQKIASILSNIDKQIKQLEDHLSKLKTMRKSIINERLTPPKEDKIVQ